MSEVSGASAPPGTRVWETWGRLSGGPGGGARRPCGRELPGPPQLVALFARNSCGLQLFFFLIRPRERQGRPARDLTDLTAAPGAAPRVCRQDGGQRGERGIARRSRPHLPLPGPAARGARGAGAATKPRAWPRARGRRREGRAGSDRKPRPRARLCRVCVCVCRGAMAQCTGETSSPLCLLRGRQAGPREATSEAAPRRGGPFAFPFGHFSNDF